MATASRTFCGVCETQHVVKEAAFWCPECDEGICTSCEKHHRALKGTRNHEVTSIDNYKQIPPTIACQKISALLFSTGKTLLSTLHYDVSQKM